MRRSGIADADEPPVSASASCMLSPELHSWPLRLPYTDQAVRSAKVLVFRPASEPPRALQATQRCTSRAPRAQVYRPSHWSRPCPYDGRCDTESRIAHHMRVRGSNAHAYKR
jgi:hypothetical protein